MGQGESTGSRRMLAVATDGKHLRGTRRKFEGVRSRKPRLQMRECRVKALVYNAHR